MPSAELSRAVLGSIAWEWQDDRDDGGAADAARGTPQLRSLPEQLRLPEHQARVHELLRHFWGCVNPRTDGTDAKLGRLRDPLHRCYDELIALRAALPADERKPLVAAAITPLLGMIERTFSLSSVVRSIMPSS